MRFEERLRLPRKVSVALGCLGVATTLTAVLPGVLDGQALLGIGIGLLTAVIFLHVSFMRTNVRVDSQTLHMSLSLLWRKRIDLAEITSSKTVTIGEMAGGGWGYRVTGKQKRVLHVGATQAVEIHLKDGFTYQIGTKRPDELLAALQSSSA